jgi:hypothetical protein
MTNNAKPTNTRATFLISGKIRRPADGAPHSQAGGVSTLYTHLKGDEDLDTGEEKFFVVFLRDFVPVVTRGTMFSSFFRLFMVVKGGKTGRA